MAPLMKLIPIPTYTCSGQLIPCRNFQLYLEDKFLYTGEIPLESSYCQYWQSLGKLQWSLLQWLEAFEVCWMHFREFLNCSLKKKHPHLPEAEGNPQFILASHWICNFCQNLAQILEGYQQLSFSVNAVYMLYSTQLFYTFWEACSYPQLI